MSDFESLWVDRDWSRDVDLSFNPMVVASSTEQILPCPRLKSCRWLYLAGPGHYQFTSWPGLLRVRGEGGNTNRKCTYEDSKQSPLIIKSWFRCSHPGAFLFQWATPVAEEDVGELSGAEPVRLVRGMLTVTLFIITGYYWWIKTHWLQVTTWTGPQTRFYLKTKNPKSPFTSSDQSDTYNVLLS